MANNLNPVAGTIATKGVSQSALAARATRTSLRVYNFGNDGALYIANGVPAVAQEGWPVIPQADTVINNFLLLEGDECPKGEIFILESVSGAGENKYLIIETYTS